MPKIVHNETKYFLKQHCHKIANATSEIILFHCVIKLLHRSYSCYLYMYLYTSYQIYQKLWDTFLQLVTEWFMKSEEYSNFHKCREHDFMVLVSVCLILAMFVRSDWNFSKAQYTFLSLSQSIFDLFSKSLFPLKAYENCQFFEAITHPFPLPLCVYQRAILRCEIINIPDSSRITQTCCYVMHTKTISL